MVNFKYLFSLGGLSLITCWPPPTDYHWCVWYAWLNKVRDKLTNTKIVIHEPTIKDYYNEGLEQYKKNGIKSKINAIVIVTVETLHEVTSPSYDLGITEDELVLKWRKYYQ